MHILNPLFNIGRGIKIPGLQGLSLYDVLEMYIIGIAKGALATRAGAISYSFFMSLFPFLLFVLNLLPLVSFIDYYHDVVPFLEDVLPSSTVAVFEDTIENIFEKERVGLLSTSFVFSMFLMANGVNSLFSGFQNSYHTKINANYVKQYITAFCVALFLALFLFLAVIAIPLVEVYIDQNLEDFGVLPEDIIGLQVPKYIMFTMMFYTVIAMFYYFGSPEKNSRKYFTPGATLSTILFLITTYLFGIYVENFAQYNELYGSIGAILILMLYIWLNSNILLLGYELNASLLSLKKQAINKLKKKE
ncbi:MAG: YihY/virulence factor BrkB family protein [Flavobacteriaceae bacterium]|nr:YihY/virulence factor BrkB family protein [Flavobacteriaceae bacterium]